MGSASPSFYSKENYGKPVVESRTTIFLVVGTVVYREGVSRVGQRYRPGERHQLRQWRPTDIKCRTQGRGCRWHSAFPSVVETKEGPYHEIVRYVKSVFLWTLSKNRSMGTPLTPLSLLTSVRLVTREGTLSVRPQTLWPCTLTTPDGVSWAPKKIVWCGPRVA